LAIGHVPHLHRLHSDDERVDERAEQQQRRRGTADRRVAAREMDRVGDRSGRVR
jgi:hypothetical protein